MRIVKILGALILLCVAGGRLVAGEPTTPASADGRSFTFAAIGDIPYEEEEFPLLRRQLAELAPSIPFLFHVGDIKRSTVPFREDAYSRVADELKRSKVPLFITIGDNEYTDAADPVLALSYWKKYFNDLHNHWQHGIDVQYQPQRRENVAFVHQGVLFIMIHLVGGNGYNRQETAVRLKDDVEWLQAGFDRFGKTVRAAVIVAHSQAEKSRKPVADALIQQARKFAKPILYIHGDGHRWIKDRPFGLDNITRVQIDQGGIAPPLLITVQEAPVDGEIFSFERNLTDEYKRRREVYVGKRPMSELPKTPAESVPPSQQP
jgi:hypothetical protein